MRTIQSGQYLLAEQDDGNLVVYDNGVAVWDKWSYEASHQVVTHPIPSPTPINQILRIPTLIAQNVNPIGMSYWRNISNHINQSHLYAFLSINDEIILYKIDKNSLTVLESKPIGIHHTGEGCYFSAVQPNILYIPTDRLLFTINVETGERLDVWKSNDKFLWQCHSSYDGQVHSATIKDTNYNIIKWAVLDQRNNKLHYYDVKGEPDECQIDKSGNWLVIKEDNNNRIIEVATGKETTTLNEDGALGHSDNGFNCMLGENDYSFYPGALDWISFQNQKRNIMYSTGIWNMGYVSFTNALPLLELKDQFCLVTTPNELIKVKLDGSMIGDEICSNLTEDQSYENRPKANLCPRGEYAIWTAWVSGQRNVYIIRI